MTNVVVVVYPIILGENDDPAMWTLSLSLIFLNAELNYPMVRLEYLRSRYRSVDDLVEHLH